MFIVLQNENNPFKKQIWQNSSFKLGLGVLSEINKQFHNLTKCFIINSYERVSICVCVRERKRLHIKQ